MNNATLDKKIVRKHRKSHPGTRTIDRWPLYTGREPTVEEAAESIKSLSQSDINQILINAGIIDKDGNLTEIYRP